MNSSPYLDYGVRRLVYKAEYGLDLELDDNWSPSMSEWQELEYKYTVLIEPYLKWQINSIIECYFKDVYKISNDEGYFWSRVEYGAARSKQHWHCIAQLPRVLDPILLTHIMHRGRVVRDYWLDGQMKIEFREKAMKIIRIGYIALNYLIHWIDSLTEPNYLDSEGNCIDLKQIKDDWLSLPDSDKYKCKFNPVMRDPVNHKHLMKDRCQEEAMIAALCQIHNCKPSWCGGDSITGANCRHGFPKPLRNTTKISFTKATKTMKYTEAHVSCKRNHVSFERLNNVNKTLSYYFRVNNDCTPVFDPFSAIRYTVKYICKSNGASSGVNECSSTLMDKVDNEIDLDTKSIVRSLCLAHMFNPKDMSRKEVFFHSLNEDDVFKYIPTIKNLKCSQDVLMNAHIIKNIDIDEENDPNQPEINQDFLYPDENEDTIMDESTAQQNVTDTIKFDLKSLFLMPAKSSFMAYTKRLDDNSKWTPNESKKKSTNISYYEFVKSINFSFSSSENCFTYRPIKETIRITPHFSQSIFSIRPESLKLFPNDTWKSISSDVRSGLYNVRMECLAFIPFHGDPAEHFLSKKLIDSINSGECDLIDIYREFLQIWKDQLEIRSRGIGNEKASQDHCFQYRCFQNTFLSELEHNSSIKDMRGINEGKLLLEKDMDEMETTIIDATLIEEENNCLSIDNILHDEFDLECYLEPMHLLNSYVQEMPDRTENDFKTIDTNSTDYGEIRSFWNKMNNSNKTFKGGPPRNDIEKLRLKKLDNCQLLAVEIMTKSHVQDITTPQTLFLSGRPGSGKTEVIKHIYFEQNEGEVLLLGMTGPAARNLQCATVEGFFGLSYYSSAWDRLTSSRRELIRNCLKNVKIVVIDEISMATTHLLAVLDDRLRKALNTNNPWGGIKMLFVGDFSQLPPVNGQYIWQDPICRKNTKHKGPFQHSQTPAIHGHQLYKEFLQKNVICLDTVYRSEDHLSNIAYKIRNGIQSEIDYDSLFNASRNLGVAPDVVTLQKKPITIMYDNRKRMLKNTLVSIDEVAAMNNALFLSVADYSDNAKAWEKFGPSDWSTMIEHCIPIYKGMEVVFVQNINVYCGITNNTRGIIKDIVIDELEVNCLLSGSNPPIDHVIMDIPNYHSETIEFPENPTWVRVFKISADFKTTKKHRCIDKCKRRQFPFVPAHAITVHKCQGSQYPERPVIVDLDLNYLLRTSSFLATLLMQVAITRADGLDNLYLSDFSVESFLKLSKSDLDNKRRNEEILLKNNSDELLNKFDCVVPDSNRENALVIKKKYFGKSVRSVGIDPGQENFAVAIWHCEPRKCPILVFCKNFRLVNKYEKNLTDEEMVQILFRSYPILERIFLSKEDIYHVPKADELCIAVESFPKISNLRGLSFKLVKGLEKYLDEKSEFKLSDDSLEVTISSGFLLHATLGPFSKLPYLAKTLGLELFDRRPYYENRFLNDDEKEKERANDRQKRKNQTSVFARALLKDEQFNTKELKVSKFVIEQYKSEPLLKGDDLGDAMLHGLYRPLIPKSVMHSAYIKETSKKNSLKDFGKIRIISFSPGNKHSILVVCEWSPNEKFIVKHVKIIETPYSVLFPETDLRKITSTDIATIPFKERIKLWENKLNEDNFLKNILNKKESIELNISKVQYIVIFSRNLSFKHPFQHFMSLDLKTVMIKYINNKKNIHYKAFNSVPNMWHLTGGSSKTCGVLHEVWESFKEIVDILETYMNVKMKVNVAHDILFAQQDFKKFVFEEKSHTFYKENFKVWSLQKRFIECLICTLFEIQKCRIKNIFKKK